MPKTLLAVDDSATMRKVLEITFNGEDFTVVTADGPQAALAKLGEKPSAIVIDTVLGGEDGYALCKEIRKRDGGAAIVLLASRYNPYDAGRGKDAGADDFMDKPFDTQQMLDKVRKAVLAREGAGASAPVAQPQPTPAAAAARPAASNYAAPAPVAAAAAPVAAQRAADKAMRPQTLAFGDERPTGQQPPSRNEPRVDTRAEPVRAEPARAQIAPVASGAQLGAAVNGQLAGKLGELGLSQSQADAVLELSREVVERVVWEVVPQLAEALIKEEIARLTR